MKAKCLFGICLVFVAMTVEGCRKKSPSVPEAPVQQAKESVSVKAGPEQSQPEETEYFALFMEGKKVGHAIQNRVVTVSKVTT